MHQNVHFSDFQGSYASRLHDCFTVEINFVCVLSSYRLCVAYCSVALHSILMALLPVATFTTGYRPFSIHPKKRLVLFSTVS